MEGEARDRCRESAHERSFAMDEDSMEGMCLTFDLASEGYGLEIRHVIEIIGIQPTAVPNLPD